MKNRSFNSRMHFINEEWVAKILGLSINPQKGADILGNEFNLEVKFKLIYPNKYTHISWRVLDYQLRYNEEKTTYWGLGEYWLSKEVSTIKIKDLPILENLVTKREIYIVKWDWMKQFPIYHQSGKTNLTEWNNYLIFPKKKELPAIIKKIKVDKGNLYFTEGIDPEKFKIT